MEPLNIELDFLLPNNDMVQRRAARYVTNRQRNTSSVGDMLQHLEWRILEDRRRDARLVMMYKISHDKVAFGKSERLSPPLRHSRNMHSVVAYHQHWMYYVVCW
jgi:hypothetical protein